MIKIISLWHTLLIFALTLSVIGMYWNHTEKTLKAFLLWQKEKSPLSKPAVPWPASLREISKMSLPSLSPLMNIPVEDTAKHSNKKPFNRSNMVPAKLIEETRETIKRPASSSLQAPTSNPSTQNFLQGHQNLTSVVAVALRNLTIDKKTQKYLSSADFATRFYAAQKALTTEPTVKCNEMVAIGSNAYDHPYLICLDLPVAPKYENCLVYSFGIANMWYFEDELAKTYKCDVFAFDPSMKDKPHRRETGVQFYNWGIAPKDGFRKPNGKEWYPSKNDEGVWTMKSLMSIYEFLKHENRTISILKIDVEGAEFLSLKVALKNEFLQRHVVQLAIEWHVWRSEDLAKADSDNVTFIDNVEIYNLLLANGFRLFHSNRRLSPGSFLSVDSFINSNLIEMSFFSDGKSDNTVNVTKEEIASLLASPDFMTRYYATKRVMSSKPTVTCRNMEAVGMSTFISPFVICLDPPVRPTYNNCLVYSFGVGEDWRFEDEMGFEHKCKVFAFDPRIDDQPQRRASGVQFFRWGIAAEDSYLHNQATGIWPLKSIKTITRELKHENIKIDVLKMDIDGAEFGNIKALLLTGFLQKNVRQLAIEWHVWRNEKLALTDEQSVTFADSVDVYNLLLTSGFKLFHSNRRLVSSQFLSVDSFLNAKLVPDFESRFSGNEQEVSKKTNFGDSNTEITKAQMVSYLKSPVFETRFFATKQALSTAVTFTCKKMVEVGKVAFDHSYEVCYDPPYTPIRHNCLVYSFGIANKWKFEDEFALLYYCDVFAFDPSMIQQPHKRDTGVQFYNWGIGAKNGVVIPDGTELYKSKNSAGKWTIKSLPAIVKELDHENRKIAVLKMDVEGAEFKSLKAVLESGFLQQNVVQLLVEWHVWRTEALAKLDKDNITFTENVEIYNLLLSSGFKLYHTNRRLVPRCFLSVDSFVNSNFAS